MKQKVGDKGEKRTLCVQRQQLRFIELASMQQAHKLEPFLMSSVSRCVLGHPEGKIGKVKSTDYEVREGVKFCDDNK